MPADNNLKSINFVIHLHIFLRTKAIVLGIFSCNGINFDFLLFSKSGRVLGKTVKPRPVLTMAKRASWRELT